MIGSCTNSSVPYPPAYGSDAYGPSASVWSPVASGATAEETQDAIDDTGDEGVVTSIGGAPSASPIYTATGLLNSFVQAGTPLADASSTGPWPSSSDSGLAAAAQTDDGAVLAAEDASGTPGASSSANYQSIWGTTLQTDPGMATTVANDAMDQGLVSTLSLMA